MKKLLIGLFFILFLCSKNYSQELKLIENNEELVLISISNGKEKIIESFSKPLLLYMDYSYYFDKENKIIYFLYAQDVNYSKTVPMGLNYYLEKFDIQTERNIFKTSCDSPISISGRLYYHISSEGYLEKNRKQSQSKILLSEIEEDTFWCDM